MVKNLPASAGNTRDMGSIPVARRSPEVGNGNPLQYSCLGNSMDREAWDATIMGFKESDMIEHEHSEPIITNSHLTSTLPINFSKLINWL